MDQVCACVLSCFSRVWRFATPWTIPHQAPLSMGFSWQEYWSGLPCPTPGNLPDPGIKTTTPVSLALKADFFFFLLLSHQGSPRLFMFPHRPTQRRWRSCIQSAKTRPGAACGSDQQLLIAKFRLRESGESQAWLESNLLWICSGGNE